MTPTEHETYALKMRTLALQTLVDWNADLWHELSMRSESDLRAALFQEAFDLASEKMMKIIEHGTAN